MKLYIAKLGSDLDETSVLSTMCVKYDAKSSILPAWLSPEHGELEVSAFTKEEFRIEELDEDEYSELAGQHQKLGINLFLHIRRPKTEDSEPDEEN